MARRASALLLVAACCLPTVPAYADEIAGTKTARSPLSTLIPNFGVVTDNLFRGAQPSDKALEELSAQGIKTIVDLRLSERRAEKEQWKARKLGMNYFHLPMGYGQPSDSQLNNFLAITQNPALQPVYVHCRLGADRTGTLIGIYRILQQNWSLSRTYSEMRSHHFKPWLFGLKRTVKHLSEQREV